MDLRPVVEEVDQAEDVGFYFKYMGGVAFAKLPAALEAPGATEMVAASSKHGLVFFSDLSGVYALQTSDLAGKLSTAVVSTGYVPPRPADVCLWHKPLRGITQLALSGDEAVLAAVDGAAGTVSFFPLADMRLSGTSEPRWALQLNGVKQFAWCKAAEQHAGGGSGPGLFLIVTSDRALTIGRYGDEGSLIVAASFGVEAADWCPAEEGSAEGSPAFAYSTGRQLVIAAVGGSSSLTLRPLASLPLEHPQESSVVFESVRWVLPNSLLLGGTPVEGGGEGGDEYSSLMMLRGWAPNAQAPPQGATLYVDLPVYIEPECTPRLSGPYLHAVAVPRWGVLVRCHRKAVDEHVRLMRVPDGEFGSGGNPQAVAVTEEPVMIRLPNGPDGGSNCVLGLGFDTTVQLEPLPHPLNAEKPPLVPPPVLLIVTSDGVLRVYGFGHLQSTAPLRPGADAVIPLPAHLPAWAAPPSARRRAKGRPARAHEDEEGRGNDAEKRRAVVESDSESGEEVTSPGIIGGVAAQPPSKRATFSGVSSSAPGATGLTLPAGSAPTSDKGGAGAFGAGGFGAGGFGVGALAPASGTVAAAAPSGTSKPGPSGFGFGFSATSAAAPATSAPAAPSGGAFGFTSGIGGGVFGAAPLGAGMFGSPVPPAGLSGAAGGKDGGAGGGLFSAAAMGSTGGAMATPATASGGGGGAAGSPAFGFGAMSLGAVSTPQLGGASAPFGGGARGLFAPAARLLSPPVATDEFTPSATFTGPKPGFTFTTRDGVTGYYKDKPPPAAPVVQVVAPVAPVVQPVAARKQPAAAAPAAKIPTAVDILKPTAKPPAAAAPPLRPASPDVPAPKAKLADESKEAASAEASFLRELHEVRRMAAKLGVTMKDIAAGCPDACGTSGGGGYKAVGASVEALARRAAALRTQYERANKRCASLFDGLGSLQSMLDALQLFSGGGGSGGPDSAMAALEANLPLEPALDGLRRDISARLEALSTCLDELEDVLDSWEAPQGGGQPTSARMSSSVLYNTIALSGSALCGAANRVVVLAARLEELGACPPGLVQDPSGPLAGLVSWCTSGGGSSSAGDTMALVARGSSAAAGGGTPSAAARTPDQKAAGSSSAAGETQWHTPRSPEGRRSPLLAAGSTPPSPPQHPYGSPPRAAGVDTLLQRLQALARVGGKVRVTSAVRPPPPLETPGAALLQLMSSAEAARGALPEGPEPSSPPRAQIKPTLFNSMDAAPVAAGPKAAAPAQPAGFNFSTLAAAAPGSAPPTPSVAAKMAGAPAGARLVAAPAAQAAVPAAPAATKRTAAQPPIPSMAQLQAANKLQAQRAGAGSAVPGAAAAAAAKPAGSAQPPVPSMALFAQAAQLQQKALVQQVAPAARPTDSGSSAGSTATSRPPVAKPQTAAAPPVPSLESMRAAAAAQARLQQHQQPPQQPQTFGAAGAGVAAGSQQPPAGAGAPAGSGFGFSAPAAGASSSSSTAAATTATAFGALAATGSTGAPAAKVSTTESGTGGASFGFGALSFGAPAQSTPAGGSAAGGTSLFGLAPSAAFGAATGQSMFGSIAPAASTASAAAPLPAAAAAATTSSQAPAAAAPAGVFGATPTTGTAGVFGAPAPAGVFGAPAATGTAAASAGSGAASAAGLFGGLSFGNTVSPGAAAAGAASSAGGTGSAAPFGSFGMPAAASGSSGAAPLSAPAASTSLFGTFASSAAVSSAAMGTSGFGVFSSPSTPAATHAAAAQPAVPGAALSSPFGVGAAVPAHGAGLFGTQGGIQSNAAMPTVQAGVFSAFGQAPAFGSSAAAVAPAFGSPATLGGGAAAAFGAPSPAAPAAPVMGGSMFGSSSFGAPAAFGSPAPVPPAAPFGGGFGQSSSFGAPAAGGGNAFSGFAMQAAGGVGSAAGSAGGFGAFASSAPTPPAPAGGGFAAFAGQGGGFGGFGSTALQQQQPPAQGGAFGSAGGTGFGAFGGLGGGMSTPAASAGASSDLWKPRK